MLHLVPKVDAVLTPEEWRLVSTLRGLPASPLREKTLRLIDELMDFISEPRCPEAQADGVPCENVHRACEQCRQVVALVEGLRGGFRRH
jgi:hypothetical protein